MVDFSGIGRGFVRSGSGFVSTPTTRAAARAAGTFDVGESTGYAGAYESAKRLITTLKEAETAYAGTLGKRSDTARATQAAAWAVIEREKAKARIAAAAAHKADLAESGAAKAMLLKCGAKPTTPPRYFADHNITPTPGHDWICRDDGWIWTMDATEKVQVEKAIAESDAAPYTPTPEYVPKTPATTPPAIPKGCPRGNRYSPTGFEKCDAGYHVVWEGWFPTRNRYCDCDTALPEEEEGKKGIMDILNALTKGEISLNSIILAAAVVLLIISLIKR